MYDVAVVKYEKPFESLKKAVALAGGLGDVSAGSKVVIKPNICGWYEGVDFPKYGVLTTTRLIEDVVILLGEYGVKDISIVEGVTESEKESKSLLQLAAKGMGLDILSGRYGVKIIDVHKAPFTKVTAGNVRLSVNTNILDADYVIDMPVLKTHDQALVSLGIKNLKGVLNMASRKVCHNADQSIDLNYHISKLPEMVSPSFTIIDGIYTLERGPLPSGRAQRSNIIIASKDLISADKVGATILGIDPQTVPHITLVATNKGRPTDLRDINVRGEIDIKTALQPHESSFDIQLFFERRGIKGVTFPKADRTLCTYCAYFMEYVVSGISMVSMDKPFDDIEILTGKIREPSGVHKHTLLVGQCQVKKHGKNPLINHCVEIRGCPPSYKDLVAAYKELGVELPGNPLAWRKKVTELFTRRYVDRPEFDEAFFKVR
ncbi:MAG: DUF362 domain-containing protein [Dehalococcoidia bacterium]